jgi:hypothetical protein
MITLMHVNIGVVLCSNICSSSACNLDLIALSSCDGLIPHPASPTACLNKDSENFHSRGDQGSNGAAAYRRNC